MAQVLEVIGDVFEKMADDVDALFTKLKPGAPAMQILPGYNVFAERPREGLELPSDVRQAIARGFRNVFIVVYDPHQIPSARSFLRAQMPFIRNVRVNIQIVLRDQLPAGSLDSGSVVRVFRLGGFDDFVVTFYNYPGR